MMRKAIYNMFSVIVAFAFIAFGYHCWGEYIRYGITESVFYLAMSGISAIFVLSQMFIGGNKHEKNN